MDCIPSSTQKITLMQCFDFLEIGSGIEGLRINACKMKWTKKNTHVIWVCFPLIMSSLSLFGYFASSYDGICMEGKHLYNIYLSY